MKQTTLSIAFTGLAAVLLGTVSVEHIEARTLYRGGEEVQQSNQVDPPVTGIPEPYFPPTGNNGNDLPDYTVPQGFEDVDVAPNDGAYIIEQRSDVDDLFDEYMGMKGQIGQQRSLANDAPADATPEVEQQHEAAPASKGLGGNMLTWALAGFAVVIAGAMYAYMMLTGKKKTAIAKEAAPSPEQGQQTLQAKQDQGQPAVIVQVQPQPMQMAPQDSTAQQQPPAEPGKIESEGKEIKEIKDTYIPFS